MSKIRNNKFYIKLPIFIALALICGIFIGAIMAKEKTSGNISGNYLKFMEILNLIDKEYVDSVNVDDLVDNSIDMMLQKLDPHTSYIPVKELSLVKSQLEGNFEGIGIEFNIIKDTIYVVSPINGGPSEAVGIQTGDKIIKVDGKTVAGIGITNTMVFNSLRGKKGTKVKVGIVRKGSKKILDFEITRDKIPNYSVDTYYMIDDKTGYIKVNRFSETTYKEFSAALASLKSSGMTQLVLDLKDNPGGYMDRATDMADDFLDEGKLIVYTDGKGSKYDNKVFAYGGGDFETGAVIVLVNEGSASASEIVSGALQDNDRALIVGRRTYGKGLVQRPIPLSDQSELRLTISRYYTPSGRSIQKPYDKDNSDKYNHDLLDRYKNGEFFSADKIKFADSLKYKTKNNRIVYGGGGIMPDVFVPRDTSDLTDYLVELFNRNLIREYTLEYYTDNKDKLKNMSFAEFKTKFQVTDEMLMIIVKRGEVGGLKFNKLQFEKSKTYLKYNVKAYIARSLYGSSGFYPIINETDEIYKAALKQFDKAAGLLKK